MWDVHNRIYIKVRKSMSGYQRLGGEAKREWLLSRYRISFWDDENDLEQNSGNGCNNAVNVLHTTELHIFSFWLYCMACGISAPQTGIEPVLPTVEAWSLNHWMTREVPGQCFIHKDFNRYCCWWYYYYKASNLTPVIKLMRRSATIVELYLLCILKEREREYNKSSYFMGWVEKIYFHCAQEMKGTKSDYQQNLLPPPARPVLALTVHSPKFKKPSPRNVPTQRLTKLLISPHVTWVIRV